MIVYIVLVLNEPVGIYPSLKEAIDKTNSYCNEGHVFEFQYLYRPRKTSILNIVQKDLKKKDILSIALST